MNILELSEMEHADQEMIPEILPVDARLSIQGSAKVLTSLFQSALEVTPAKEIIPNTGYTLLEAVSAEGHTAAHVKVSATDGERSITVIDSSFSVKLAGSVLLPGKRILDILRLAGEETVRVDVLGTTATIRAGRAQWKISTPSPDAYLPTFSEISDIDLITVSRKSLLRALELVYAASSKTASRQSLMQVNVSKGHLVACDGVRAHKVRMEDLPKTMATTLPNKFVETAMKELRSSESEYVEIGSSDNTVVLHFGSNILMSQRLNFKYPDVEHLMIGPALSNDENLAVDVKELQEAVKRVRVNSDPEFYSVVLSLRGSKDSWSLTVRARDKEGNASQETIPVSYDGKMSRDLVVNHKYLTDFLNCVSGEASLKLGESTKSKQAPIFIQTDDFTGSLMLMAPHFVK